MRKKTQTQWMQDGDYLPKILRDFHDQKDIFKWIWRRVEKRRELNSKNGSINEVDHLTDMNWASAHVFVIDFFLWFMALHGYTLQPIRKDWESADWAETNREMREEDSKAFMDAFKADRREARKLAKSGGV